MKNFIFYLPILFGLLFSTTDLFAYTTSGQFVVKKTAAKSELPLNTQSGLNPMGIIEFPSLTFNKLNASIQNLNSVTQSNLNMLYCLCFALVLFNLMAQIKITIQMVHLFFLFRKKEDSVRLNF